MLEKLMFSKGQGAQWVGMGCHLVQVYPSFLDTIRKLDSVLSDLKQPPSWKLEGKVSGCYVWNGH